VALQHNGGGFIHTDTASCFIHILRNQQGRVGRTCR
jgi:hypothetical protein